MPGLRAGRAEHRSRPDRARKHAAAHTRVAAATASEAGHRRDCRHLLAAHRKVAPARHYDVRRRTANADDRTRCCLHPEMVQLDEPSKGIMPVLVDKMFELFLKRKKSRKIILLGKQNVEAALAAADRAYIIDQGMAVQTDTAA